MELKVVWTKRAKNNYVKILEYIGTEFGENPNRQYHERIEKLITLLVSFPELGVKQSGKHNLRGIILYRRTTVFYTFNSNFLKIVNVVDNRWKK